MMENIDTIRLNRLSDPKFKLSYSVHADGSVILKEPTAAICVNLAQAIDFARCSIGEQPFCIKCKNPLNEGNNYEGRYYCLRCQTSFLWNKPSTLML